MRTSSWSARAGMIASRSGPPAGQGRLLDREPVRVGRSHDELVAFEADEDPREHRSRLVARRSSTDLVDRREESTRFDAVKLDVERGEPRKVLRAVDVQAGRMAPGRHGQHAVAFLVDERHGVVGKKPHEIGEEAPGNHDARIACDLTAQRRAQRDLHVGGREREPAFLGTQKDPAEDLDGAARRDSSRDHTQRGCEVALRARDAKRGVGRHVCTHYWKNKTVVVVGVWIMGRTCDLSATSGENVCWRTCGSPPTDSTGASAVLLWTPNISGPA